MFLHGNGGDGSSQLRNLYDVKDVSDSKLTFMNDYLVVCPSGHERSWNIFAEDSTEDDVAFLDYVIEYCTETLNGDIDNITFIGSSNGSAMTHRYLLEGKYPINNAICEVTVLTEKQHDGTNFKKSVSGSARDYSLVSDPQVSNTNLVFVMGGQDPLIPFEGGYSKVGATIIASEKATLIWAKHKGYTGDYAEKVLVNDDDPDDKLYKYCYPDQGVALYNFESRGHNPKENNPELNYDIYNRVLVDGKACLE